MNRAYGCQHLQFWRKMSMSCCVKWGVNNWLLTVMIIKASFPIVATNTQITIIAFNDCGNNITFMWPWGTETFSKHSWKCSSIMWISHDWRSFCQFVSNSVMLKTHWQERRIPGIRLIPGLIKLDHVLPVSFLPAPVSPHYDCPVNSFGKRKCCWTVVVELMYLTFDAKPFL